MMSFAQRKKKQHAAAFCIYHDNIVQTVHSKGYKLYLVFLTMLLYNPNYFIFWMCSGDYS